MEINDKKLRIVTAASLFDGHDAAINIMRRIMQANGAEVIHLGHNRSVYEVVEAAIEEDANAIAITSYQGGHSEYFKYMKDLLDESGCGHIKIFGGGGGTILPEEIRELHAYGINRIYSPDDGRQMGLEGMIRDLLQQCATSTAQQEFAEAEKKWNGKLPLGELTDIRRISRQITLSENNDAAQEESREKKSNSKIIGITGTGGAGKSSVTDEIVRRMLAHDDETRVAVISVDPSKKKTGGALLGDRIRMNSVSGGRVYMRSLATREDNAAISNNVQHALNTCRQFGFNYIILETAGTGQSDTSIVDLCDVTVYVMTPEYGAASQLEKINMLDYASIIAINKFDKPGADDALHEVRRQYKRSRNAFSATNNTIPVVGTVASKFHDEGINTLFELLLQKLNEKADTALNILDRQAKYAFIIPPSRIRYLSSITEQIRAYNGQALEQARLASSCYQLYGSLQLDGVKEIQALKDAYDERWNKLSAVNQQLISSWHNVQKQYSGANYSYVVRGNTLEQPLQFKTLSGLTLSRVYLPKLSDWGDILLWQLQENVPGSFPFTAGVFPLKREGEDPTRMFAGEGCPERTNRRFHYVAAGQPAKRLSTAFDSVTLYGEDPGNRPDIYGKVGNSGVNVATVDDAKKLYSGFDLCAPQTSVSMTINGPAPVLLAFFLNAAIDQQCEKWITNNDSDELVTKAFATKYANLVKPHYYNPLHPERLPDGHNGLGLQLLGLSGSDVLPPDAYAICKAQALQQVRGTVQADILKEDQAQNTCIFNTAFALRLMGDVQEYFIQQKVRNFYSVSISGYHIAEAGANPITQLAFTLSNGFTYVEYYLSRGMSVDDFAPNLSFFFSNGMDPEYSVIGRVARRIWAKAMKFRYGANERSQKLKYHIQTSGRSLHAQEIDFNDIRTTLQALYAIYDNCNSLHTNAYDEAITTPTEESVRRAMAIQLIINRELGLAKTENFVQGSFVIEELTHLVEEAVLAEFDRLSDRGGVLGAMERMYQRNKIQEESLFYEHQKHTGELPIVGVNTFLNKQGSPTLVPQEVIRSSTDEKDQQIENLRQFMKRNEGSSKPALEKLKDVARQEGNLFEQLMETVKFCSLGEITHALYEVGGQYRRNM